MPQLEEEETLLSKTTTVDQDGIATGVVTTATSQTTFESLGFSPETALQQDGLLRVIVTILKNERQVTLFKEILASLLAETLEDLPEPVRESKIKDAEVELINNFVARIGEVLRQKGLLDLAEHFEDEWANCLDMPKSEVNGVKSGQILQMSPNKLKTAG